MKWISGILALTLCSEMLASWAAWRYHNNMFVYHFYAPLLLIATALYFQNTTPRFKKKKLLGWVIPLAITAATANCLFLQPLSIFNTNFVLLEGLCIVSISLFTFYDLFQDTKFDFMRQSRFWVALTLLLFWCSTYMSWAILNIFTLSHYQHLSKLYTGVWIINLLTYAGLGLIGWLSNKKYLV